MQGFENTNPSGLHVPVDILPITPGPDALPKQIRGIRANVGGEVTVTTILGNSRVMTFLSGETRYIACTHVTAATATGLEGLV